MKISKGSIPHLALECVSACVRVIAAFEYWMKRELNPERSDCLNLVTGCKWKVENPNDKFVPFTFILQRFIKRGWRFLNTIVNCLYKFSPNQCNYLCVRVCEKINENFLILTLTHTYTHTHIHTCIHTHPHTHIYIYIYIQTHIWSLTCTKQIFEGLPKPLWILKSSLKKNEVRIFAANISE